MKIILHVNDGSSGILALGAALALDRDGYEDCVYSYDGFDVCAKKNKESITAWETLMKVPRK